MRVWSARWTPPCWSCLCWTASWQLLMPLHDTWGSPTFMLTHHTMPQAAERKLAQRVHTKVHTCTQVVLKRENLFSFLPGAWAEEGPVCSTARPPSHHSRKTPFANFPSCSAQFLALFLDHDLYWHQRTCKSGTTPACVRPERHRRSKLCLCINFSAVGHVLDIKLYHVIRRTLASALRSRFLHHPLSIITLLTCAVWIVCQLK